jgi:hypothetical protein
MRGQRVGGQAAFGGRARHRIVRPQTDEELLAEVNALRARARQPQVRIRQWLRRMWRWLACG